LGATLWKDDIRRTEIQNLSKLKNRQQVCCLFFIPLKKPTFTQNTKKRKLPRIVAIDYGLKRVGLAVTDPMQIIANTLTTVNEKEIIPFLKDYFSKEEVSEIVVGKPQRMDGSDTHASQPVEKFVALLRQTFPSIPVVQVDERFTSLMAQRTMIEMGMKKKDRREKGNVDQISAAIILQTWLEMKG